MSEPPKLTNKEKMIKICTNNILDENKSTKIVFNNSQPSDYELQNHANCQNAVLPEHINDDFDIRNN